MGTQIREPVPGKQILDGHDEARALGGNGLEKRFRGGLHVAGQEDVAIVPEDADVHAPSVQINTTVQWVLVGVESHGGLRLLVHLVFPLPAYHRGYAAGEASIIITALHLTASSLRSCVAAASGSSSLPALGVKKKKWRSTPDRAPLR